MANLKLSQIAAAGGNPASGDFLIGVNAAGTTDNKFTITQISATVKTSIGNFGTSLQGLVPNNSPGGTTQFLRADATFAVPPGAPGGSTTQLQYNNAGAFGGIANATTDGTTLNALLTQNSQSVAYTTVASDAGKHILHPTADNNARTFTIAANASVAYAIGTTITFVNQINTVTIAIATDTMVLAGPGTTGNRTLAANGIATALKIAATTWIISGTGLT